jgi:histidine triad (HIT) family protein
MASIFSKIVAGEIPCYKVAETDNCFAFLDINPVVRGHVLCIPKQEVDYIFDLDDPLYDELFAFAHRVARAVKQVCPCRKVGMAVLGLEVPHAHVHLIPMQNEGDMNFHHHVQLTPDEFSTLADQLAKAFQ